MSGKYFLQSGLRVLELLVEMDLVSEVLTYRKSKGEEAYAAIINRLDRPVSGLVLMAKNKKEAILKYRLLSYDEEADISRLDIHLITGRHHQIRVQLASRNMPVAGDGKYGGNMAVQAAERIKGIRIKRGCIALCAVSLKVDGKLYEVKPGF